MRARKSSTSLSVFMSRSWSRSVPRYENLRKVRFLGASATRSSPSPCCRNGAVGEKNACVLGFGGFSSRFLSKPVKKRQPRATHPIAGPRTLSRTRERDMHTHTRRGGEASTHHGEKVAKSNCGDRRTCSKKRKGTCASPSVFFVSSIIIIIIHPTKKSPREASSHQLQLTSHHQSSPVSPPSTDNQVHLPYLANSCFFGFITSNRNVRTDARY